MPKKTQVSEDMLLKTARRRRPGETDDSKRGRRRTSRKPTATVVDGWLRVGFNYTVVRGQRKGGPNRSWQLPTDGSKYLSIRKVLGQAVSFAKTNGATQEQVNAVKKALTSAGYHLGKQKEKRRGYKTEKSSSVWATQGGLPSLGKRR